MSEAKYCTCDAPTWELCNCPLIRNLEIKCPLERKALKGKRWCRPCRELDYESIRMHVNGCPEVKE
jgi:hypothetical protein